MRQIIAIGGGGFSEGSEPELDDYVLKQSQRSKPNIGFLGTASGDAESYRLKFYTRFSQLHCTPSHLTFFRRTPNIEAWVMAQDVIFVGGGNTMSMLAIWQAWGLGPLLEKAHQNGTVLAGISAGANCWFESCLTDARSGILSPLQCLGFISGSCCPHYSSEVARQNTFERLIGTGELAPGIAIDDGAAVHFMDGKLARVISGNGQASAYTVVSTHEGTNSQSIQDVQLVSLV